MTKLINTPFADSGDKAVIPQTDVSGNVNWSQGFPADYSKNPDTDPSAKRIERDDFNGLLNYITAAIREIQVGGVAPFITATDNGGTAFSYGAAAMVIYKGAVYQSTADNNTTVPDAVGSKWTLMGSAGRLVGVTHTSGATAFTPNPNTDLIIFELQGAGGGGGGCQPRANGTTAAAAAGGGSAGSYLMWRRKVIKGESYVLSIGIGGQGGVAAVNSAIGSNGGDTTIAVGATVIARAPGGSGGGGSDMFTGNVICQSARPRGGEPTYDDAANVVITKSGEQGGEGLVLGSTGARSGRGGSSLFGCGGEYFTGAGDGSNAQGHGAGGAGANSPMQPGNTPGLRGGAGSNGRIIIWEFSA